MTLAASELNDSYAPVHLLAGSADLVTAPFTVKSGQNLSQYHVVARETASGKLVEWDPAGAGGANIAVGILLFACDATGGDKAAEAYIGGSFNLSTLVFKGTATALQKAAAFDNSNINVRTVGYSG